MNAPFIARVISLGTGPLPQQEKPEDCSYFSTALADEKMYADAAPAAKWLVEYDFLNSVAAYDWRTHLARQQPSALHLMVQAIELKSLAAAEQKADAGIKVVRFAKKHPDMNLEAFREYWRIQHGPIACASPWLYRYEQLHVDDSEYLYAAPPWDGFTLSYFDSLSALQEHTIHPAGKAAAQDTVNFLASGPLPFVIMKAAITSDA